MANLWIIIIDRANMPIITNAEEVENFKYVPKLQLDSSGQSYFPPNLKKMRYNSTYTN